MSFAHALACAASLTGLSLPETEAAISYEGAVPAEMAVQCWHNHRAYDRQGVGAIAMVRTADGKVRVLSLCFGLTAPGDPVKVWADPADWLSLVHEGCHALRRVNGLPNDDAEEALCRQIEREAHTCPGATPAIRPPLKPR